MRKTALSFHEPPRWPATWQLGSDKVLVIGRWHFLVESKSEGGFHAVDLEAVDIDWPEGGCTCRGFTTRKTCRHWRAIRRKVGLDS